jgi:hypothetical protein
MFPVPEASFPAVEIHRGVGELAKAHAEIGQKHHPQPAPHGGIDVHHFGDAHDQPDDQFRHGVARGCLAAVDHRARRQILAGA